MLLSKRKQLDLTFPELIVECAKLDKGSIIMDLVKNLEKGQMTKMGGKVNRFDKQYDIRLAHYSEIGEIMTFIDRYWKKGHILGNNRELFLI